MSRQFNILIGDAIGAFTNSDAWRVVKYRMEVYKNALNTKLKAQVRAGKGGQDILSAMDTVDEVIRITERLGSELKSGKLDADVALTSLKIIKEQ